MTRETPGNPTRKQWECGVSSLAVVAMSVITARLAQTRRRTAIGFSAITIETGVATVPAKETRFAWQKIAASGREYATENKNVSMETTNIGVPRVHLAINFSIEETNRTNTKNLHTSRLNFDIHPQI
jgi:hypothetical protein